MIERAFADTSISTQWKAQLADDRELTPAQLTSIAKVVRRVDTANHTTVPVDALAHFAYQGMYQLRFGRALDPEPPPREAINFTIAFLNCSHPPEDVEYMFRTASGITACFYGLPGTGKTAFAQHLARLIDKPLLVTRASNLLRPYVGETEMLIQRMFEEAQDEQAVLLLDEADSFLTDRRYAVHSWEITQTNELLTQLERFRGVFIATTNAFDRLDAASVRRFDVKLHFDVLSLTQKRHLFELCARQFKTPDETPSQVGSVLVEQDIVASLSALRYLTAGDVAVVVKRLKISDRVVDAQVLLDGLRDEYRHKKDQASPIGFVA